MGSNVERGKRLKKQPKTLPQAPTANAKIIRDLMVASKVKGNFKDFVILADNRLIDWRGSYDMVAQDGKPITAKSLALVHKSKLANIIGESMARQFWHPGIGRVAPKPFTPPASPQPKLQAFDDTTKLPPEAVKLPEAKP